MVQKSTIKLSNKIKKTVENKYGVKCILSLEKNKEKAKNAIITKYGTNCTFNVPEIRDKANKNRTKWRESSDYIETRKAMTERCWETKKRNNTCNTSKAEETIFGMLSNKFKDVKRNYKCDLYPFHCDFYIVDLDVYIEYQGSWVHGKKPYDENDFDCITLLKKWKVKSLEINYKKEPKNYYRNAIHVWTVSDPLKRKVAKDNNLNWKEFWNIQEVKDWITTLK